MDNFVLLKSLLYSNKKITSNIGYLIKWYYVKVVGKMSMIFSILVLVVEILYVTYVQLYVRNAVNIFVKLVY